MLVTVTVWSLLYVAAEANEAASSSKWVDAKTIFANERVTGPERVMDDSWIEEWIFSRPEDLLDSFKAEIAQLLLTGGPLCGRVFCCPPIWRRNNMAAWHWRIEAWQILSLLGGLQANYSTCVLALLPCLLRNLRTRTPSRMVLRITFWVTNSGRIAWGVRHQFCFAQGVQWQDFQHEIL